MHNDFQARAEFRTHFLSLLGQLPSGVLTDYALIDIASDRKPWLDTGIDLAAGEAVSSFATGKTHLKGTGLSFGADFQLWFRIGVDGEIFRGTRASHSFTAEQSGRLYLASYFPGEWSTRNGALATPDEVYALAEGVLTAFILRWRMAPLEGLQQLATVGDVDGLIASEIQRLTHPVPLPAHWYYLWFVGPAEIYRPSLTPQRNPAIACHTRNDVGLLLRDVSLPLEPNTRLRWSWCLERLPSQVREDQLPTHDYLSIAVEFDNGQDITYYWSAELPVGTVYRCPIPSWTERETHVVIRSGLNGLGEWLEEERDLYRDYAECIGGALPANIVRVWLIAVSFFQSQEGRACYADIRFVSDTGSVSVSMGEESRR